MYRNLIRGRYFIPRVSIIDCEICSLAVTLLLNNEAALNVKLSTSYPSIIKKI
jgi:hypothetical protein